MNDDNLDCIVVGYNETPFDTYEGMLKRYGEDSEAYRDLKFSFVDLGDRKLNYPGLMNYAYNLATAGTNEPDKTDEFRSGEIPNLAAAYLMNYLQRRGYKTRHINLFQDEKEKFIRYLESNPLCVAITTTFYILNFPVSEMVEFIRKHNKNVKIVVGGPLIANHIRNYQTIELRSALDDIGADIYVTDSQGELTLAQIIECLKNGGDLGSVSNIIYFENGRTRRTGEISENNSMDENYIDWRALASEDFGPTIQMRTARSCAFNCSFCNYPARAGKLTLAGIDTIKTELDSIRKLGNVKNVVFIDDTFNVPLPRFKDICRMMIDENYGFNWFSYFRCSNSDEEAIELMAKSGCKGVFLGIESGSPTILKNMNKAATIEKYAQGMKMLREHDVMTFGSFIVGFPGETDETVKETSDFIKENKPDYYRAQIWYCEPGTPIDQHRQKYQITGDGFVWSHASMDSLQAMDHIDEMFLTINESQWLPQWSFDFWFVPYLLGKNISMRQFKDFMTEANKLLALQIASVAEDEKITLRNKYLGNLVKMFGEWYKPAALNAKS